MNRPDERWKLDRRSVHDAFDRWLARQPTRAEAELVSAFMMDLVVDPFARGREDDDTGVWSGWAGFVLVVYIPDRERHVVSIVDIDYG